MTRPARRQLRGEAALPLRRRRRVPAAPALPHRPHLNPALRGPETADPGHPGLPRARSIWALRQRIPGGPRRRGARKRDARTCLGAGVAGHLAGPGCDAAGQPNRRTRRGDATAAAAPGPCGADAGPRPASCGHARRAGPSGRGEAGQGRQLNGTLASCLLSYAVHNQLIANLVLSASHPSRTASLSQVRHPIGTGGGA